MSVLIGDDGGGRNRWTRRSAGQLPGVNSSALQIQFRGSEDSESSKTLLIALCDSSSQCDAVPT